MKQAAIHTKIVAQSFSFLRRGRSFCVVIVLILTAGLTGKASGQYFPMEQPTYFSNTPLAFPSGQQTFYSHSPYSAYSHDSLTQQQLYLITPQANPEDSFAASLMPSSDFVHTFENNTDESILFAAGNPTTSRGLLTDRQSQKPPKWDFSFPRCRSLSRSKPPVGEEACYDPSEKYLTGCYRRTNDEYGRIRSDFQNFYSRENFANILVGYGVHAAISNTSLDKNLNRWYQNNVRSNGLGEISEAARDFGSWAAVAPVIVVGAVYCCDRITYRFRIFETRGGSFLGEFASRTTRGYLVGTPVMLLSQNLIGAGRPDNPNSSSRWQPFRHDKGVSGHAFVGAMPFITLAQMSDNFWLKAGFYTCSTMAAWSRFNDERHYLSQVLLGWYLAYLSCRAVSKTEYQLLPRGLTVFPVIEPRTTGIGLVYQW